MQLNVFEISFVCCSTDHKVYIRNSIFFTYSFLVHVMMPITPLNH